MCNKSERQLFFRDIRKMYICGYKIGIWRIIFPVLNEYDRTYSDKADKKFWILQSKNAYVIMPLGKRNDKSMWDKKKWKPLEVQLLGLSSCLIIVDKKPLG